MNNTNFHVWVLMQLEPDMIIQGGHTEREKREIINADFFAQYNAKNPFTSFEEKERREDEFLKQHKAG